MSTRGTELHSIVTVVVIDSVVTQIVGNQNRVGPAFFRVATFVAPCRFPAQGGEKINSWLLTPDSFHLHLPRAVLMLLRRKSRRNIDEQSKYTQIAGRTDGH